ncbi:hypothetical protein PUN28_018355 [Cardiocondyla obscurior]|uniref:Uncharacterized protein n=1 Tax=Cardiocondyla obscurior TaxID=286306 RepID=A0AAW2EII1_9HYME
MPCDGDNPNCDRRRELLAQLKCLISSMDQKKPCEWDETPRAPTVCCVTEYTPPCCVPVKPCKSFEFRASVMHRCICIKRNGLQDRCMMWDCMGRPECMTKLYPVCGPGRAALMKLTDLGDEEIALQKFYCADRAREAALAAYCRLVSNKTYQKEFSPCNKSNEAFCGSITPVARNNMLNATNYNLDSGDRRSVDCSSLYRLNTPPSYVLQSCNVCPPCY